MGAALVARGNHVLLDKGLPLREYGVEHSKFAEDEVSAGIDPEAVYGHFDLAAPGARETERDDPVKKCMPGAPAAWDKITIFNVLTHTSGIPDFTRSED